MYKNRYKQGEKGPLFPRLLRKVQKFTVIGSEQHQVENSPNPPFVCWVIREKQCLLWGWEGKEACSWYHNAIQMDGSLKQTWSVWEHWSPIPCVGSSNLSGFHTVGLRSSQITQNCASSRYVSWGKSRMTSLIATVLRNMYFAMCFLTVPPISCRWRVNCSAECYLVAQSVILVGNQEDSEKQTHQVPALTTCLALHNNLNKLPKSQGKQLTKL